MSLNLHNFKDVCLHVRHQKKIEDIIDSIATIIKDKNDTDIQHKKWTNCF